MRNRSYFAQSCSRSLSPLATPGLKNDLWSKCENAHIHQKKLKCEMRRLSPCPFAPHVQGLSHTLPAQDQAKKADMLAAQKTLKGALWNQGCHLICLGGFGM
eukprot:EG_transcript_38896